MTTSLPLIAVIVAASFACGKSAPATEAKVEIVDVDLSSGGAAWKGYSIKAPKGSQVMEDPRGLRVAGKGCPVTETCPYFDIVINQKKPNFQETKELMEEGATTYKDKLQWTSETADTLEWTREPTMENTGKTINFERIVNVGGNELGCKPLTAASKASDIAAMKEACATLAKK
jgi:hypothetical protein